MSSNVYVGNASSKASSKNHVLRAKDESFVTDVPGDGNCLFWCLESDGINHKEVRKRLSQFLLKHSNKQWLHRAYHALTTPDISIEQYAKKIKKLGYWATYFDAFVCGLFLR